MSVWDDAWTPRSCAVNDACAAASDGSVSTTHALIAVRSSDDMASPYAGRFGPGRRDLHAAPKSCGSGRPDGDTEQRQPSARGAEHGRRRAEREAHLERSVRRLVCAGEARDAARVGATDRPRLQHVVPRRQDTLVVEGLAARAPRELEE